MNDADINAVREVLQGYASRGVFRSFRERALDDGVIEFSFCWLVDEIFVLTVDPSNDRIQFEELLPAFPADSPEFREIQSFVVGRMDPSVRPHRRVDPDRAEVGCESREDAVSISMVIKDGDWAYATQCLLNLVNEVFGVLHLHYSEYMTQYFGIDEE